MLAILEPLENYYVSDIHFTLMDQTENYRFLLRLL